MYGTNKLFNRFKMPYFELPDQIHINDIEFRCERDFIEFYLRNDWIQRMLGIKCRTSNGLFPDLKAEIYDHTRQKIRVEAELWAENYTMHDHEFAGCDLILSFFRQPNTKMVRGCPVWSFYKGSKNANTFDLCLFEDINYNFSTHHIEDGPNEPLPNSINHHIIQTQYPDDKDFVGFY